MTYTQQHKALETQREAGQLVEQLCTAASPQQHASAARALVTFCGKQKSGKEWSDAGGRAGVPAAALVQAAMIADSAFQAKAVWALGRLVDDHQENQSTAGAAGAIAVVHAWTEPVCCR